MIALGGAGAEAQGQIQAGMPIGDFRVAEPRQLGLLELGVESVRDGRFTPRPVSDMMLRIDERYTPPPRTTPRGWGGAAPMPVQRFLEIRLFAVSGGRIAEIGRGRCAGGSGGVIACNMECDGGVIGLRQRPGPAGEPALALLIGEGAREDGGGPAGQIRLGACEAEVPLVLRPRGGAGEATIALERLRLNGGVQEIGEAAQPVPGWGRTETTGALPERAAPRSAAPQPAPRLRAGTLRD